MTINPELLGKGIIRALDAIKDPVTGNGLFATGRVAGLDVNKEGKVSFALEAPTGAVAQFQSVREAAEKAVRAIPGVVTTTIVLTAHDAPAAPKGGIENIGAIIAVASSKGGVGKSTCAVNLACAFAALGKKTGLLDLDVYGPSAPTMLGLVGKKPETTAEKLLKPLDAYGLKAMSIGFVVDPDQPMVWRAPMATGAARQMMSDVAWGALDVLVIDMPPGTGDVHLSLMQQVPLAGVVMVSTPQELALADVRRGAAMCEKMHAPILGVIENMAYLAQPDGTKLFLFGEGGARRTAEALGAPFLGEIALEIGLREAGDAGAPLVATRPDHPISKSFIAMAQAALDNVSLMARPAPTIRFI